MYPLILPCPTPSKAFIPSFFNFFSSYIFIFKPSFLREFNLFAYSSGCKIFPGSETRSLAKKVPSSNALKLNWFCVDTLFLFPITFIEISLVSFFDL